MIRIAEPFQRTSARIESIQLNSLYPQLCRPQVSCIHTKLYRGLFHLRNALQENKKNHFCSFLKRFLNHLASQWTFMWRRKPWQYFISGGSSSLNAKFLSEGISTEIEASVSCRFASGKGEGHSRLERRGEPRDNWFLVPSREALFFANCEASRSANYINQIEHGERNTKTK